MKSSNKTRPILCLTYYYGVKGCCPAEWADDKIYTMSKLGHKVILLSSASSKRCNLPNVMHYRIPSLSWVDFKHELNEIKELGESPYKFNILFSLPFIVTFGVLLDWIQKILLNGLGGGKWAWTISSFCCALPLAIYFNCQKVFTTGGPASSHLSGVLLKLLTRKKVICELQDPLCGRKIGRNATSSRLLGLVEKIVIKTVDKIIYVTQSAAEEAKSRCPKYVDKIHAVYPGSRKFVFVEDDIEKKENRKTLELIHLGTLYSTRNLKTLIEAIDQMLSEGIINEGQITILNLGEIYGEIKEHHLSRSYVKQKSILPREDAVREASHKMVSLLVQHDDDRSQTTIPYKTYDYMNIGNPILGLTNSTELSNLLKMSGHLAVDIHNIGGIKKILLNLITDYHSYQVAAQQSSINIDEQVNLLLK